MEPLMKKPIRLDRLKKLIRRKFGTRTRFADLAGEDRYEVQKAFMPAYARDPKYIEFRKTLAAKAIKLKRGGRRGELSRTQLGSLKKAIDADGGCYAVAKAMNVASSSLYELYNGQRMVITTFVQGVLDKYSIT
jgi:hypothetical protein